MVLLLGVVGAPVPTEWHMQKELFILSKFNPKIQQFFNFEKHLQGPYSQSLYEEIREPVVNKDLYTFDPSGAIHLTLEGKRKFNEWETEFKSNKKFMQLLNAMKLARNIYDKLSKDELLFLIYLTYPQYIKFSNIYNRLVKEKGTQLAKSIYKKGLITEERYVELIRNAGAQR